MVFLIISRGRGFKRKKGKAIKGKREKDAEEEGEKAKKNLEP